MTPSLIAALIAATPNFATLPRIAAVDPLGSLQERIILINGDDVMTASLSGRWTITEIATTPVADGVDVWIEITNDRIAGVSGCNNFSATLEISGSDLVLGPIVSTRKLCPKDAMDVEQSFLRAMNRVNGYIISANGTLTLSGFGTPLFVAARQ